MHERTAESIVGIPHMKVDVDRRNDLFTRKIADKIRLPFDITPGRDIRSRKRFVPLVITV
jgi:hypothetical protein